MDKKKKIAIIVLIIGIVCILLNFLSKKEEYTVSVDTTGGTTIANKVVKEGTTIGQLEVPKKDGYTFLYWTLDGKRCNNSDEITKDIHLIAVWESDGSLEVTKYKVTFNVDGGSSVESVEVEEENVLVKPADPKKEGYTFVEWQLDGIVFDFTTKITKDIELKAIWKKESEVTVSFDTDGGSKVTSQVLKVDEVAKKPSNPTRIGYKFVEWQLDGKTYDFASKVAKDIKLVAKWEKIVTYTVTFDSNSGTKVDSQTVEKDKTATKPSNPTRSGYKFVEWQLDGKKYNFASKVTKNIKLVAKWEKVTSKETYTITFNIIGNSSYNLPVWTDSKGKTQNIEYNNFIQKPSDPKFVEWQLNGKTFDFSSPITSNIELKAYWEKTYSKITYDTAGGSSMEPAYVLTGKAIPYAIPYKRGYKFKEWYLDGKPCYRAKMVLGDDLHLVATYEKIADLHLNYTNVKVQTINGIRKYYSFNWNFNYSDFEFYSKTAGGSLSSTIKLYRKKDNSEWELYESIPLETNAQMNYMDAVYEKEKYFYKAELYIFDKHNDYVAYTDFSNVVVIEF